MRPTRLFTGFAAAANARLIALLIGLVLAACAQQPQHDPNTMARGEDPPPRRHGNNVNPYAGDVKMAGQLARGTYRPERADDPRNQNILVSVRYLTRTLETNKYMAAGFRRGDPQQDEFAIGVTEEEAFRANGLSLVALGDNNTSLPFNASEIDNRTTEVLEETIGVVNLGQGTITMQKLDASDRFYVRGPDGRDILVDDRSYESAALRVQPEIVDPERELIRVKVWPELVGMLPGNQFDSAAISATAIVKNGGMLLIGGNTEVRPNSLAKTLLTREISGVRSNLLIFLRVWY